MQYEPPRETDARSDFAAEYRVGAKASLLEGRLHPMTLVLGVYNSVRRMILPLIPLIDIKQGGDDRCHHSGDAGGKYGACACALLHVQLPHRTRRVNHARRDI